MIYLVAVILSFVACVLSFACEITEGNITHVRYGRELNAGAALFPAIPFFQLVFVGVAWLVTYFVPDHAFWILTGLCVVLFGAYAFSLWRLRAEWKRVSHPPRA